MGGEDLAYDFFSFFLLGLGDFALTSLAELSH